MRTRLYAAPQPIVQERLRIERAYEPSARDLAPALVKRMLDSRPVVGERVIIPRGAKPDKKGVIRTTTEPIYGPSKFRNVIVDGRHV